MSCTRSCMMKRRCLKGIMNFCRGARRGKERAVTNLRIAVENVGKGMSDIRTLRNENRELQKQVDQITKWTAPRK
jgi:cell shape-determining protein MreC